ncbi:MAG: hypothetical protein ACI9Y1_002203 [Lentisphaeria bacterium]|jgi:hypothetical protein
MNLISIKSAPLKKRKKGKNADPLAHFEKYWHLVQSKIQANESFQEQIDVLKERYKREVLPAENSFNDQTLAESYRLMDFFTRKSLSRWDRCVLVDWISENVDILLRHPYYDPTKKIEISAEFTKLLQLDEDEEPEEFFQKQHQDHSGQEDLFSEFETNEHQEEDGNTNDDESDFEDLFKPFYSNQEWEDFQHEEEGFQKHNNETDRLLKSSSINTMFRRIAKKLHPDLETDDVKKEEKHHLMSKLLSARKNQDIATIFLMHREFISEAPLEIEGTEMDNIVELLKRQISKLDAEREKILCQSHETAAIVDFFEGKTEKQIAAKIKKHIKGLKEGMTESQEFLNHATSVKKLKLYLEQRRYNSMMEDDYFFSF